MRKTITLILVAVAMMVATPSQAQVKFGLRAGLNVTDMSLDKKVVKTKNRTGFFVGPTVKFTLPIVGVGIDASALYDQRETEIENSKEKQGAGSEHPGEFPLRCRSWCKGKWLFCFWSAVRIQCWWQR